MMRILILGATGFTGAAFVNYLSGIQGVAVTSIVHHNNPAVQHSNVSYQKHSLTSIDYDFLAAGNYDYIFHLARISGKRWGDIGRYFAGIQGATANKKLLSNINRLAKKPKLIYLSGSLMYGHMPGTKAMENVDLNPAGFAKYYKLAEQPIVQAIKDGADNLMMLRAPWIIGSGSWYKQLYADYIRKNNMVPHYGNEQRSMSLITVEDCAGMLWYYATNARYQNIYNIYTFQQVAYKDFLQQISTANNCASSSEITEGTMIKSMGKTMSDSINCDVVLDTQHKELLKGYKPIYPDLKKYITELAKG